MRILLLATAFHPSVGGLETQVRLLAEDLIGLGQSVVVVTDTPVGGPERLPFRVVRRPTFGEHARLLRWCEVCHHNNLSLRKLHPLLWRRPLVVTHHGEYLRLEGGRGWQDRLKLALARFCINVACSGFVARQFRRCTVIPNQYDSDLFRTLPGERDRELIFVGRLVSQKGCDVLLESLALLAARAVRPRLTIVGGGEERERLLRQCAELGLSEQVAFLGARAPREIAEQLNRHRVLVVPSRYREPFGVVALEGLACGCLPIVAREGGLIEAIGPHGLDFENGNPAELAARIDAALADQALVARKLHGREAHLAMHERRRVAERYLAVYEAAVAGAGADAHEYRPAGPAR